ncbi:transposase [Virgibacillus sp. NKC19-16]|uniref:REP-associated tyrosine transposase n=1 Tax=Virgibacillus salidurans TaxID=2831673 RepID=UPI001F355131|nr:transposase [Virgibacillus sp. NKC19-16]UJL46744.1 transposase [Virgibacillus sp. NKC19-16]
MSRKPRIWFPGATYHITARGNRRDSIFYDLDDYQYYMDLISSCKEDFPFVLHAYGLMPNHIHLLLETKEDPPGAIIKFIHSRYAIYFNKRYELSGHVFQGRFYAKLIDTSDYFLKASRYIHLNPVEAEIVNKPENYVWSSYPSYMTEGKDDALLETKRVLSYFQEPQRKKYCSYVESTGNETVHNSTVTH